MIDVHAHFAEEGYEFPAAWENIKAAGVKTVILAADTLEHAAWHADFCASHDGCYFTVGIHPEFASSFSNAHPDPHGHPASNAHPASNGHPERSAKREVEGSPQTESASNAHPAFSRVILNEREGSRGTESASNGHPERSAKREVEGSPQTESERHLRDSSALPQNDAASVVGEGFRPQFLALATHPKCVAVGEIGLDYHYEGADKGAQRELFEAQLRLAASLSLPVQIHSRDACADTLAILQANRDCLKGGFLMHCYSYGAENLDAFLALGAYVSFGGVVCFKNARRAVEAAALCPMDRILSETDSPYLSPFRGEKNTPANIPVIVEKLATIKGVTLNEMRDAIRANARALFSKLV